jgi:hypothetical protein
MPWEARAIRLQWVLLLGPEPGLTFAKSAAHRLDTLGRRATAPALAEKQPEVS